MKISSRNPTAVPFKQFQSVFEAGCLGRAVQYNDENVLVVTSEASAGTDSVARFETLPTLLQKTVCIAPYKTLLQLLFIAWFI